MGRTNDAILYGGTVHLYVDVEDDEAYELAKDYLAVLLRTMENLLLMFSKNTNIFYKIDKLLFSPQK